MKKAALLFQKGDGFMAASFIDHLQYVRVGIPQSIDDTV